MLNRLDNVLDDVDKEFGLDGSRYMYALSRARLQQLVLNEGGC